ncbi:MAG TPA: GTPase [Lacipirellula sp.]
MSSEPASFVSILTPPGRGAIAVVAASGSAAFDAVDGCFTAANSRSAREQPRDRIAFGHCSSGAHREEVVLIRGSDDVLEVHCHGGAAAVARIVDTMLAAGCRQLPWTEWIARDRKVAIAVDADIALAQATTRRTASILLDQRSGALAQAITDIRSAINRGDVNRGRQLLTTLIERSNVGLHLTAPWQVAIAGRPNVGKSSLINALVGYERAIVFDQPGTTRDVLTAETAIDGWPVRLADAAGLRTTRDELEAEGVKRARRQLASADLVLWVIDAAMIGDAREASQAAEQELHAEARDAAQSIQPLVVLNKIDLLSNEQRAAVGSAGNVLAVSALTGAGLDSLLAAIAHRLVPASPVAGEAVPFTQQQVERLKAALAELDRGDLAAADAYLTWT